MMEETDQIYEDDVIAADNCFVACCTQEQFEK